MTIKKILVVEDSDTQAELFKFVFPKDSYDLIVAGTGKEALQALAQESSLDLIITDIMMPEMDGIEFLRMAHKLHLTDCPVLIISSMENLEKLKNAVETGAATKYLVKPWELDQVRKIASELLSS